MLHAKQILLHLWAEAMNTACHVHNRITVVHELRLLFMNNGSVETQM